MLNDAIATIYSWGQLPSVGYDNNSFFLKNNFSYQVFSPKLSQVAPLDGIEIVIHILDFFKTLSQIHFKLDRDLLLVDLRQIYSNGQSPVTFAFLMIFCLCFAKIKDKYFI